MPTFCRHNRILENCPICSKKQRAVTAPTRIPKPRRENKPRPGRGPRLTAAGSGGGMVVRRIERAPDDGYEHDLVPGLRASSDARRLAEELAFADARLRALEHEPPGLYAQVALGGDSEESAWLCFLIAYLSPTEDDQPFASIANAHVPWATGELPDLDGVQLGPRTAHDPTRGHATIVAYRAWAQKAGSQHAALEGDTSWPRQRRFDRAYERLALPGLHRAARYEFLVLCSRLGVAEVDPWSLMLGSAEPTSPVLLAAKRAFGIGDPLHLQRRATDLAGEAGVPVAALDLALHNWAGSGGARVTGGVHAEPDRETVERIAGALGVAGPVEPPPIVA